MAKEIEPTKRKILQRRTEMVWDLHCEEYTDIEIGEIMGMDRTWAFSLRKRIPDGWKAAWSKVNK